MRIGLRVFSNAGWLGGVNYVLTWARATRLLPAADRPHVTFLHADPDGQAIAVAHSTLVDAIADFGQAHTLDLDFVYPATQVFEAPFGAPWAGWIPDWQCKHLPQMFDEGERARRDLHYTFLATRAPALALSSRMALEDTRRIVGDALVPVLPLPFPAFVEERVLAAPPEAIEAARARHGLPERFFLVCNQFWRHKNHLLVLHALAKVRSLGVVVVFTGALGDERWPDYGAELDATIDRVGVRDSVIFLGAIPRDDQLLLMRAARAIVQPSRFEGWSSVVEEARALGRPMLLSRFPVHEEQHPPGARFFDPEDPEELAALMRDAWRQPLGEEIAPDAERHREYAVGCARGLLELARVTRGTWDVRRHDPRVLLPLLVEEADRRRGTVVADALAARVARASAVSLRNAPPSVAREMQGGWRAVLERAGILRRR